MREKSDDSSDDFEMVNQTKDLSDDFLDPPYIPLSYHTMPTK